MIITKKNTFFTFWAIILMLMIFSLIHVSSKVKQLESQLTKIDVNIKDEQELSRTLDAEWAYLTDPSRIERLSKELLPNLKTIQAKDIVKLDNLAESKTFLTVGDDSSQEYTVIKISTE